MAPSRCEAVRACLGSRCDVVLPHKATDSGTVGPVSVALGFSSFLALAPGSADVQMQASQFRVRDPNRDLMLGVAPTVGDKLFTMGSPNPAQWAPELGFRFVFGSWRYNLLVRGAVVPLVPLRKSIAQTQRGAMLEGAIGARIMPVQHRLVRFGLWLGLAFDEIRARVELSEEDGGARGRKRVGHVGPALGTEFAFPVVFPRAHRPWSVDVFLAHELRVEVATRSTLRLEDETGSTRVDHRAPELTVIGPFSGVMGSLRIGVEFRYDLVTAGRVRPRAGARLNR